MKLTKIVLPIALSMSISGCIPLLVGGAATAGYLAMQERGAKAAVADSKMKAHIKDKLFSADYKYLTDIGINVLQGDVMLTGVVSDNESMQNVEKVVKLVDGVNNVYNNLIIASNYSAGQFSKDSLISTQFKTRLLAAKDVYSINYLSDTILGNLYIIGIASTETEKERVLHIARTTKGVTQVYNYIRVGK